MAVCEEYRKTPKYIRGSLAEDLVFRDSPSFSGANSNHVVVVMDALRGFSMETFKWALAHVIKLGYLVTLLGVMHGSISLVSSFLIHGLNWYQIQSPKSAAEVYASHA